MKIHQWPLSFSIAHRGASQLAPENTLAALKTAKAQGALSVECDVMLTQDQHPVIFHDETLRRTTTGRGRLSETTLSIIQTVDAGSWFSVDYKNERVPTLAQWLQTAATLNLALNLEIKATTKKESMVLAELVIDHLQKYWPPHSGRILISSSNAFALMQVAQRAKLPLGFITEKTITEKNIKDILKMHVMSVHQPDHLFNQHYIDFLHAHDLRALAYTVNDTARFTALKKMGIDGVFTDTHQLY